MIERQEITTKAALARELGVAKSRLTQLAKTGLPVLANGKLDRRQALRWVAKYTSGFGGGWHIRREGDIATKAAELLNGPSAPERPTVRFLLDRLIARSWCLPEFLIECGVRDMVAIAGVIEVWQSLICQLAGDDIVDRVYDWMGGDDLPHVEHPDYSEIATRLGVDYDPLAVDEAIEKLF